MGGREVGRKVGGRERGREGGGWEGGRGGGREGCVRVREGCLYKGEKDETDWRVKTPES